MTNTLHGLRQRRQGGEIDGFTLIEILVVIVVLGILSAVVVYALGGFTSQSAVAACESDGATISTAMAAFVTQNPSTPVTPGGLISGTAEDNNTPYIVSMPANSPHYAFEISTAAGSPTNATAANQLEVAVTPAGNVDATNPDSYFPYTGPSSCAGVS